MINTILFILEIVLSYIILYALYKKNKIDGLYYYCIAALFIANIQMLKTINITNIELNLGIVLISTIFISTNIIVQKHGLEQIKNIIIILLTTSIIEYVILYMVSNMIYSSNNIINASFDNISQGNLRIFFANTISLMYSLYFNTKLYYFIKKENNHIWISNTISSIIINLIYLIIFYTLAFFITNKFIDIISMLAVRYILSIIVCIIGTIVIYQANKINGK